MAAAPGAAAPVRHPDAGGAGITGGGYPWPWSVYRWMEGEPATPDRVGDGTGSPRTWPGSSSPSRRRRRHRRTAVWGPQLRSAGGPLAFYEHADRWLPGEVRRRALDATAGLAVWEEASASTWSGAPVWVHGDMAPSNLLVENGRLVGARLRLLCAPVGDPACDLVMAWTYFSGRAGGRSVPPSPATTPRGRGAGAGAMEGARHHRRRRRTRRRSARRPSLRLAAGPPPGDRRDRARPCRPVDDGLMPPPVAVAQRRGEDHGTRPRKLPLGTGCDRSDLTGSRPCPCE